MFPLISLSTLFLLSIFGHGHRIRIEYCTKCKWVLRANWLQCELLSTFEDDLKEVSMAPIKDPSGTFRVVLDDKVVLWDRTKEETKGFPEAKILKQIVRDIVNPVKSLGHSDVKIVDIT